MQLPFANVTMRSDGIKKIPYKQDLLGALAPSCSPTPRKLLECQDEFLKWLHHLLTLTLYPRKKTAVDFLKCFNILRAHWQ